MPHAPHPSIPGRPETGDDTPDTAPIPGRLEVALRGRVVRRALKYMVVVGAILITINHGDAIVRGELTAGRFLRMLLTCLVPYCVSTLSSVEAVRAAARDAARSAASS